MAREHITFSSRARTSDRPSHTSICFVGFAQCKLAYLFMANTNHYRFGNTHQCLDKHGCCCFFLYFAPIENFQSEQRHIYTVSRCDARHSRYWNDLTAANIYCTRQLYFDARVSFSMGWENKIKKYNSEVQNHRCAVQVNGASKCFCCCFFIICLCVAYMLYGWILVHESNRNNRSNNQTLPFSLTQNQQHTLYFFILCRHHKSKLHWNTKIWKRNNNYMHTHVQFNSVIVCVSGSFKMFSVLSSMYFWFFFWYSCWMARHAHPNEIARSHRTTASTRV